MGSCRSCGKIITLQKREVSSVRKGPRMTFLSTCRGLFGFMGKALLKT